MIKRDKRSINRDRVDIQISKLFSYFISHFFFQRLIVWSNRTAIFENVFDTIVEKMFRLILTLKIDFESINQIIKIIVYYCFKFKSIRQRQNSNNWNMFQVANCRFTVNIWCLKLYKNVSKFVKFFQRLMRRYCLNLLMFFLVVSCALYITKILCLFDKFFIHIFFLIFEFLRICFVFVVSRFFIFFISYTFWIVYVLIFVNVICIIKIFCSHWIIN